MTITSSIIILISSIIGALGYILSAYISNYREINSMQKQKSHLQKIIEVYDIMNNTIAETRADRFIIFTTHNGSGMPGLFKSFKVSALYGSNIHKDTKHLYQNIPVDEPYTRMLLDIQNNKEYLYHTIDESDSLLNIIYKNEGVKLSKIYHLIDTGIGMMYCSISSHDHHDFNPKDFIQFEFAVERLKIILKEEKRRTKFMAWLKRFLHINK